MAWHIRTHDIPPLRCYNDALLYWQRIKPWRGRSDKNARPLAGRNKSQMTIRRLNDGSIAMRLYDLDVVTYHPDGDVTLQSYASMSTSMFAHCLTPSGVGVSFGHVLGNLVHLQPLSFTETFLMAGRSMRLRRTSDGWAPADLTETAPFHHYLLDQPKARAVAKEYRLADFFAWCKAMDALDQSTKVVVYTHNPDVRQALREGGESWEVLRNNWRADIVGQVRDRLYAQTGCIVRHELPSIVGCNTDKIVRSEHRWSALYSLAENG